MPVSILPQIRTGLAAVGLLATLLTGCESRQAAPALDARAKGRRVAEHDIAQGVLKEADVAGAAVGWAHRGISSS